MNNNIVKIYFITFISIFTLSQINGQSKKIESLTSFNSIFQQKIVRISDRFGKEFETQKKFLQLFYYNMNKDVRWTSNNKPKKVIVMDGTNEALLLLDDGLHFDNCIADGIYANYHFRNLDELRTTNVTFEVCCMDSIGISYSVLSPIVSTVPNIPQIISPHHTEVVISKTLQIQWSVGKNTDNCGIVLLDNSTEFGKIFQNILWEKEIEVKGKLIFSEMLPLELSHSKEYSLIIWSSNNHFFSGPETSKSGAYSMEYITFSVDTTVVDMAFRVFQNYPNPFNSWTAITWIQDKENIVTINIYNILGEEVKFLLSKNFSPGKNTVIWDGTDNGGNAVSSGIYFLTIRIQNKVKTIKIVYNK